MKTSFYPVVKGFFDDWDKETIGREKNAFFWYRKSAFYPVVKAFFGGLDKEIIGEQIRTSKKLGNFNCQTICFFVIHTQIYYVNHAILNFEK